MMERDQQELKWLGFFGILRESFKIVFFRKKIFSQITIAFIIPIFLFFPAHFLTTVLLAGNMFKYKDPADLTEILLPKYSYLNVSEIDSFKWVAFWFLIEIAYFTYLLIFYSLSTVTVVYTITCIYGGKDVSFKKAMAVVQKVWKRVLITFLLSFTIVFLYDYVFGAVTGLIVRLLFKGFATIRVIIGVVLLVLFIAGFIYITIILTLATVVAVLEDNIYGMNAITKSKHLIKGKMGVAASLLIVLSMCSVALGGVFGFVVVFFVIRKLAITVGVGILCFVFQLLVILLGFVVQTIIYFVCKSYHNENIVENVADQKAMDVQLEMNAMYTLLSS